MEDLGEVKVLIIKEFAMETAKPHVGKFIGYPLINGGDTCSTIEEAFNGNRYLFNSCNF